MADKQQDPQGNNQRDPQKEQQTQPNNPQAGTGTPNTMGNDGLGGSVPGSQETMRGGMPGDHKLTGTTAQQTGQQPQNRESEGETTGDVEDSEAERRNPKEDTGI